MVFLSKNFILEKRIGQVIMDQHFYQIYLLNLG